MAASSHRTHLSLLSLLPVAVLVALGLGAQTCVPCQVNTDCAAGEVCLAGDCELQPAPVARPAVLWGVDANYVETFENGGYRWTVGGRDVDPIATLAERGARVFRLRLWVDNHAGNEEPGTLDDARIMAHRAQSAGLYVIPTLFMSRGWGADTAQDAPLNWAGLSLLTRADAARAWARHAVMQLRDDGIETRVYGIGNETDYGFCGEFRMTDDLDDLREHVWPRAAVLMRATAEGIQEAHGTEDLDFILHISRGYDTALALAFFETMRAEGVPFSYAGLSYYPSAWDQQRYEQFDVTVSRLNDALGTPVFIAETAYPAEDDWVGWNTPVDDYTLDEAGQARFLRDLKTRVFSDSGLAGAIYWSPEEIYAGADWSAMSLFRPSSVLHSPGARPALDEL